MVTKSERKWIFICGVIILVITSIPYVIAYLSQGDSWRFTGFLFGVEDGNSYIAKMLRGAAGEWLFRTPYTTFPQNGAFVFIPYYLLGKLTAPDGQHEQLVAIFQIYRWVGGLFLFFAIYEFVAIFTSDISYRRLATLFATIGGGLGWLSIFGLSSLWNQRIPLEYYSPETFGFLALYGLPHLLFARGFSLLCLKFYLIKPGTPDEKRNIYIAGLFLFCVGFMQPLTEVIIWAVLIFHVGILFTIAAYHKIIKRKSDFSEALIYIKRIMIVFVISSPPVIYTVVAFNSDPYLKLWSQQNLIISPPIGDYLLAYGLFFPLAVVGICRIIRDRISTAYLLIGWLVLLPVLAYAPYNLQRRLTEGGWVALSILAVLGFTNLYQPVRKWVIGLLLVSFLPALILILGGIISARNLSEPVYRPIAEIHALQSLNQSSSYLGQTIIASYDTSNVLPAWAANTVLLGHGPESVKLKEMRILIEKFYRDTTTEDVRIKIINDYKIDTIFWGPHERKIGNWTPSSSVYMKQKYSKDGYEIYQIDPQIFKNR